ncbi:MAG TPA: RIP metalloprotease RseP, partial [Spirochaetota bacterium]|nr:RIP metalloprotease RseP [Spirochaetota bacterium]
VLIALGFGLTILVHKCGHFIMARRAGVKVEKFAIGIGPKLFTLYKDKAGTEYIIALLPIGGYVKMKGQEDLPVAVRDSIDKDSYQAKSPGRRLSIIVAGVIMNVILAYILLTAAYMIGVPFEHNRVGTIREGSPAQKAGLKPGDTIISLNGQSINKGEDLFSLLTLSSTNEKHELTYVRNNTTNKTFISLEKGTDLSKDVSNTQAGFARWNPPVITDLKKDGPLFQKGFRNGMIMRSFSLQESSLKVHSISGFKRLVLLNPGARAALVCENKEGKPVSNTVTIKSNTLPDKGVYHEPEIRLVSETSPAARAGLLNGDLILSLNGKPVTSWEDVIFFFYRRNSAEPVRVTVLRNKKEISMEVKPEYDFQYEAYLIGIRSAENSPLYPEKELCEVSGMPEEVVIKNISSASGQYIYTVNINGKEKQYEAARDKISPRVTGFLFNYQTDKNIVRLNL